jgi:ribosome-binding protein aMBF1 (putative translation factor)
MNSHNKHRRAAGRVYRDKRTGLLLRVAPSRDYTHWIARAFGTIVRRWRRRYGFSLYEVAERAKVSRQTVTDLEDAEVWFSMVVAARVCDAMGLDLIAAMVQAHGRYHRTPEKKRRL